MNRYLEFKDLQDIVKSIKTPIKPLSIKFLLSDLEYEFLKEDLNKQFEKSDSSSIKSKTLKCSDNTFFIGIYGISFEFIKKDGINN